MIKAYLHKIHQKPPHERRTHAMQWAAGLTGFALVVWATTLSLRFATPPSQNQTQDSNQVASVVQAQDGSNATLLVATSSDTTNVTQQ